MSRILQSQVGDKLKVHILGAGSIGSLIAHDLKQQYKDQISPILLLRPNKVIQSSNSSLSKNTTNIKLNRLYDPENELSSIDLEFVKPKNFEKHNSSEEIENLIITTKSYQTESAIKPFLNKITSNSKILILQNGMGMKQNLINRYWKNESSLPSIFEGITTHGVFIDDKQIINHASRGKLLISNSSNIEEGNLPPLIQSIIETSNLNTSYLNYNQFLLYQIEKLIINCCINPITALYNVRNGDLLYSNEILNIWKSIIKESIDILKLEYSTQLENIFESSSFLNEDRLLEVVIDCCKLTSQNSSSMRQDIRNLKTTEINNLNGYITFLGRKFNRTTIVNSMIVNLINLKFDLNKNLDLEASKNLLSTYS
ncbi:PAN5 [Candida jiufengensis]|uniref:PAN5 n=1 Tax=Candida jiufengensis TaxID=497108 RepID=UPI002224F3DD|nr:PAN5 [Candida jiufengensis]KAI5956334.1 PAN5 [Candida jiufengensis]